MKQLSAHSPEVANDEVDSLVGSIIDQRYRVEALIGRGGMGNVWRVTHLESLQRLALKTLHPRWAADRRVVARFLQEARAAGALNSRYIVRIVDARTSHIHAGVALPFVVMELLEGDSLEALLARSGRLGPAQASWLSKHLANALQTIHDRSVVHRDLKPSNVFLSRNEEGRLDIKLCDFGLAKVSETAVTALAETGSGEVLGTPLYMAPEQLRSSKHVDHSVDLWAFGLLVFRVLSGKDYFGECNNTADLIVAVVNDPLVPPSQKAPWLTPAFDRWFFRACARVPGERFTSATQMYEALSSSLGAPTLESIRESGLLNAAKFAPTAPRQVVQKARLAPTHASLLALTAITIFALVATAALLERRKDVPVATQDHDADPAASVKSSPSMSPAHEVVTPPSSNQDSLRRALVPAPDEPRAEPTKANAEPSSVARPSRSKPDPTTSRSARSAWGGAPVRTKRAKAPSPETSTKDDSAPKAVSGSVCRRSSECESGLCVAERCR